MGKVEMKLSLGKTLFWTSATLACLVIWIVAISWFASIAFAQVQDTTLTSDNSITIDRGNGNKQLEVGQSYNYRDINGVLKRGNDLIEVWADTSQFGKAVGAWKRNMPVEFPDSSTGEVTAYKRDGAIVHQAFVGVAYYRRSTGEYILLPQTPVAMTDILMGGNTIIYEDVYTGVDLKYQVLPNKLKEELYVSQDKRGGLNSPYPDNDTWVVLVTKVRTTMDIKNERDGSDPFTGIMQEDSLSYGYYKDGIMSMYNPQKYAWVTSNDSLKYRMKSFTKKIGIHNYMLSGMPFNLVTDTLNFKGDMVFDPTWTDSTGGDTNSAKDGVVTRSAPATNYGAVNVMSMTSPSSGAPTVMNWSFIDFSISGIPIQQAIDSAFLYITKEGDGGTWDRTLTISPVSTAWVEAQFTWNIYSTGNNWGEAGGDTTSPAVTTQSISSGDANDTEYELDITTIVDSWYGGATEEGIRVQWTDTTEQAGAEQLQVYTSDEATAGRRPKLVVYYHALPTVIYSVVDSFQTSFSAKWDTTLNSTTIDSSFIVNDIDSSKISDDFGTDTTGTTNDTLTVETEYISRLLFYADEVAFYSNADTVTTLPFSALENLSVDSKTYKSFTVSFDTVLNALADFDSFAIYVADYQGDSTALALDLPLNTNSTDRSLHGNDGTDTDMTYQMGIDFLGGGAGVWNGSTSLINNGSDASLDNIWDGDGGTVVVWFDANSDGESSVGTLLEKRTSALAGWIFSVQNESAGFIDIQLAVDFDGTDGKWTISNVPLNQKNSLILTYDADNVANDPIFYLDGTTPTVTETQTPVGTRISDAPTELTVGAREDGTRTFDGDIWAVKVLKGRIWTPAEVTTYYKETAQPRRSLFSDDTSHTTVDTLIENDNYLLASFGINADTLRAVSNFVAGTTNVAITNFTLAENSYYQITGAWTRADVGIDTFFLADPADTTVFPLIDSTLLTQDTIIVPLDSTAYSALVVGLDSSNGRTYYSILDTANTRSAFSVGSFVATVNDTDEISAVWESTTVFIDTTWFSKVIGTDTLELTEHQYNAYTDTTDTLTSNTEYILLAEGTNQITGTVYQSNSDTVTTLENAIVTTSVFKQWSPVSFLIRLVGGDLTRRVVVYDSTLDRYVKSDGDTAVSYVDFALSAFDSVAFNTNIDTSGAHTLGIFMANDLDSLNEVSGTYNATSTSRIDSIYVDFNDETSLLIYTYDTSGVKKNYALTNRGVAFDTIATTSILTIDTITVSSLQSNVPHFFGAIRTDSGGVTLARIESDSTLTMKSATDSISFGYFTMTTPDSLTALEQMSLHTIVYTANGNMVAAVDTIITYGSWWDATDSTLSTIIDTSIGDGTPIISPDKYYFYVDSVNANRVTPLDTLTFEAIVHLTVWTDPYATGAPTIALINDTSRTFTITDGNNATGTFYGIWDSVRVAAGSTNVWIGHNGFQEFPVIQTSAVWAIDTIRGLSELESRKWGVVTIPGLLKPDSTKIGNFITIK